VPKKKVRFGRHAIEEQAATTTGGVAYVPQPFPGPILLTKSHIIDGAQMKATEACRKAFRDYSSGSITKKDLDRICGGMKR
jgi:hypothetical protein